MLSKERFERERNGEEARRKAIIGREQAHRGEITVTSHIVRAMAMGGNHGIVQAADVFGEYREAGLW